MNDTRKQRDAIKMVVTTIVILAILSFVFLFAGCTTTAAPIADPSASSAAEPSKAPVQEPPAIPVFGETITFNDGISLSVSTPASFEPSASAAGIVEGQTNLLFEFVITNNSASVFDPTTVFSSASSGGIEASGIFDVEAGIGFPPMTGIQPGGYIKWYQAWSVLDPNAILMEVAVGLGHDSAFFISPK